MLRWYRYGFDKKHVRTRYGKLVFSLPVRYASHVDAFFRVWAVKL
jgi:hypothetical protein